MVARVSNVLCLGFSCCHKKFYVNEQYHNTTDMTNHCSLAIFSVNKDLTVRLTNSLFVSAKRIKTYYVVLCRIFCYLELYLVVTPVKDITIFTFKSENQTKKYHQANLDIHVDKQSKL